MWGGKQTTLYKVLTHSNWTLFKLDSCILLLLLLHVVIFVGGDGGGSSFKKNMVYVVDFVSYNTPKLSQFFIYLFV